MSDPLRTCMQRQRAPEWYGRFWEAWGKSRPMPTDSDAVVAITTLADLLDDGIITPGDEFAGMEGRYLTWGDDGDAIPLAPAASKLMGAIAKAVGQCPSTEVVL